MRHSVVSIRPWPSAAVEREFGRLKNEYALTPLRGLAKVALRADLRRSLGSLGGRQGVVPIAAKATRVGVNRT